MISKLIVIYLITFISSSDKPQRDFYKELKSLTEVINQHRAAIITEEDYFKEEINKKLRTRNELLVSIFELAEMNARLAQQTSQIRLNGFEHGKILITSVELMNYVNLKRINVEEVKQNLILVEANLEVATALLKEYCITAVGYNWQLVKLLETDWRSEVDMTRVNVVWSRFDEMRDYLDTIVYETTARYRSLESRIDGLVSDIIGKVDGLFNGLYGQLKRAADKYGRSDSEEDQFAEVNLKRAKEKFRCK